MKRVAGCSDTTMQDLWRAVVRAEWGNRCALAGTVVGRTTMHYYECQGDLQCHHVVKRRRPHLKHVPANGILLCEHHHDLVGKSLEWRRKVEDLIGKERREWLDTEAKLDLQDWLIVKGWSRKEWLEHQKAYLQALLRRTA